MQHPGGFVASRPLPVHASAGPAGDPHPTVLVRCDACGEPLLLFEQVSRTLLTMRSYGAELQFLPLQADAAFAQCRHCATLTRFDRRLLPHVAPGGVSRPGAGAEWKA